MTAPDRSDGVDQRRVSRPHKNAPLTPEGRR